MLYTEPMLLIIRRCNYNMEEKFMVHDDTEYLDIKEKLSPDEYNEYLEIMKDFPKKIVRSE